MKVILSYGLGVDSTAILLRWLLEPETCPCDLKDLVVITAQTGGEWDKTGDLVDRHIYPLLTARGVRTVQVARAGESDTDGIVVLSDTRSPSRCHISGSYTLAKDMLTIGTVPQTGGKRLCSLQFKGWVLDQWIAQHTQGEPFIHAVGFEAGEVKRMHRDQREGKVPGRMPVYPLIEWGWDRLTCEHYILAQLGVAWIKSACVFCPFALTTQAGKERTIPRYLANPGEAMQALLMEHVAVALNPKQGLIAGERLYDLLANTPGSRDLLEQFERHLDAQPWALYDVRRVFRAREDDITRPANAVRSVVRLAEGTRAEMLAELQQQAVELDVMVDRDGGHRRAMLSRLNVYFPSAWHALVPAPAVVADKVGPGFAKAWASVETAPRQRVFFG
ncbi:hypothetical protein ACFY05_32400 [Microtetraspora fusca]|uniref:Phosphoadenosine phosphosulfate reductase n=1 Tax=Microtetraspora fusca TaxID=1997 RepID=A0ABW6VDZ4_MICFU